MMLSSTPWSRCCCAASCGIGTWGSPACLGGLYAVLAFGAGRRPSGSSPRTPSRGCTTASHFGWPGSWRS
eukprot:15465549-Alexandrium_andersonii.AAC.1